MVYVWYPADPSTAGQTAAYFPYPSAVKGTPNEEPLKFVFGAALDSLSRVRIHAIENARGPSSAAKFPILVFSHALGASALTYASQMEDLASNGYAIATIDHTYDSPLVVFPDGRMIPSAQQRWQQAQSTQGGMAAYEKERDEVWAADIRFVLDQLTRPTLVAPFAGHLDTQKIAVFGHSMGARAAERACRLDSRIRACANEDALSNGLPFYPSADGKLIDQPFLLLIRKTDAIVPTDEQLAKGKMTRAQFNEFVQGMQKGQDDMMRQLHGGSYRVTINRPVITHMGFSDLPLLQAAAGGKSIADSIEALRMINSATRAFFDRVLNENRQTLLDAPADERLKVEMLRPIAAVGEARQ
jgi:hypothetical protein